MARATRTSTSTSTSTSKPRRTREPAYRTPDGWSRLVAAILAADDRQAAAVAAIVPIRHRDH
jgi:hypothetical protein